MGNLSNSSDINQTFILEPLLVTGDTPTLSACTIFYTNNIQSCSGDTQILLGTNLIIFNGNFYSNNGLTANTISATTYLNLPVDIRITGGTYSNGSATFTNNTGGTFSVSGFSSSASFTGGTISGSTNFTNGLTANTISATTYLNLPIDIRVTGGTANNGNKIYTFTNNTGGTFTLSGLTDVRITGGSYNSLTGLATFTNNTGGTFSVSGFSTGNTNNIWTTGSTGLFSVKAINDSNLDATGSYAIAEGYNTLAGGDYSHAEGLFAVASGVSSHAEGNQTKALGDFSHAEGNQSTANNNTTHVEGYQSIANGNVSHSEGYQTTSIGDNSHAEGYSTTAYGFTTHAEGGLTIANGGFSHAEGYNTTAFGDFSHTEGIDTTASGQFSHAGGNTSIANGDGSFVHGQNSIASGTTTIVLGDNITGATDNTLYVDRLNVKTISGDTSIMNIGIDINGFITTGTSVSNFSGGTVTGPTNFTGGLTANTISASTYLNLPVDNDAYLPLSGGTMFGNIIMSAGTSLTSTDGGGEIDLDYQSNPNAVVINNDNGLLSNEYILLEDNGFAIASISGSGFSVNAAQVSGSLGNLFSPYQTINILVNDSNMYPSQPIPNSNGMYLLIAQTGTTNILNVTQDYLRTNKNTYLADISGQIFSGGTPLEHIFKLSGSTDVYVTGATTNNATKIYTFTNNTGGTFSITGLTDVRITGGTYNSSTNIATFTNNTGGTFSVTGFSSTFTGGTVSGATRFTNGLSANTISATTYLNLPNFITAANGLTRDGYNITLGGTLTGDTTIESTDFGLNYNVVGSGSINNSFINITGEDNSSFSINSDAINLSLGVNNINGLVTGNISATAQEIDSQVNRDSSSETAFISLNVAGENLGFSTFGFKIGADYSQLMFNNTGATFEDSIHHKGINYLANYHGNYTTRTLVDKEYVDNKVLTGVSLSNYLSLSGGSVTGGTRFTNGLSANTISATTYFNLPVDIRVTGGTANNGTKIYTFTNNTGGTFTLSGLTDITITGGSYNNGTTTLTNNTGGTFSITGYLTGTTDIYTTASTLNNSTLTFTRNDANTYSVNLSGLTLSNYLPLSGGVETGLVRFNSGLSATTISATTYFNLPTDVRVTGGTYNNGSLTFTNNTGGTFNVIGLFTGATDIYVTGATANNATKIYTFTNNTGGTFNLTALTDIYVTGATYSNGSATFTNNTGGTFSLTGLTQASTEVYVTGATTNNGNKIYTFTNNTGGTFSVTGLTDITITGGSYSNGSTTLTNNTGGTISISGYFTGATDISITGGTYSNGSATFTNNTGGTFSVSGFNTTLSGLTDTNIINPVIDDIVKYNGSTWVNGKATTINGGAGVNFFYDDTSSDISTYQTLNRSPENISGSTITGIANNGRTLIKAYGSTSAGLGGSQIDGGEWVFDVYASVDVIGAGLSSVDIDVYKRTSGGTETLLFNVNSGTIGITSVDLYSISSIQQPFSINASDRLIVKIYAKTTSILNRTISFYYGGTNYYSNFNTPLVVRHNDLSGLQGGSSNQYYHLTSAQLTVVQNTSGINTGDNPFTGGTVAGATNFTNGLTANTISATTYFNLPTDIRVTGGTYSNGSTTFTNNTGGTFSVTGLTQPFSGGTVTGNTIFNSGLSASTITASTVNITSLTATTISSTTITVTNIVSNDLDFPTIAAFRFLTGN